MGLTNLTNHSVALSDLFENDMHLNETDDEYHESSDEESESDDDFDDDYSDHRSFAMDDSSVAQAPSKQARRVPFSVPVPVSITGRSHVPSTLSASAAVGARSHPPGPEFNSDREVPDYREQGTDRSV